jgi:excinuclease UvrABC nuclease subunit
MREKREKKATKERPEIWTKDGGHGRENMQRQIKKTFMGKVIALVSLNKN